MGNVGVIIISDSSSSSSISSMIASGGLLKVTMSTGDRCSISVSS